MNTEACDQIRTVEIDWYADGDVVRVTPRNQQRFDVQKDHAIEVLRQAKNAERFQRQFDLLLQRLAAWIGVHQGNISKALLTLQDGTLAFVVVRGRVAYEEEFEDALAELDLELANDADLDLVAVKTMALPLIADEALRSFLDERLVLEYHHGKRA